MKLCVVICLVFGSHHVAYGQWHTRVYLEEAVQFFDKVVEETFLELEERGFCNLKFLDYTQTISYGQQKSSYGHPVINKNLIWTASNKQDPHMDTCQQMYKWLVAGNVTYANGFLVSIQKIDVTDVQQSANSRTVDDESYTFATIQGHVNLRDLKVGYDVIAELGEDGAHRFTGTFVHTLVRLLFSIQKNLHTQEITVSQSLNSLSGGLDRMVYMPANNITQVISRTYVPSNAWDSITAWRDIIVPIMTDVIMTRIAYPPVCLDCR